MLVYYKSGKKQNGVAADVHSSHQEKAFSDHLVITRALWECSLQMEILPKQLIACLGRVSKLNKYKKVSLRFTL